VKSYDTKGQLKVKTDSDAVQVSINLDSRYLRKDQSDAPVAGVSYTFPDVGSTLRIKNGKLQIQNDDSLLWHTIGVHNLDSIPTAYVSDVGEA